MHNPARSIHCGRVVFRHRKTQPGEVHGNLRSTELANTQLRARHSTVGAGWSDFWGKHYEKLLAVAPLLRRVTRGPGVMMWASCSIPSAGMLVGMNHSHSFPHLEPSTPAMAVARLFTRLSAAHLCSCLHAHLPCTPKPCPFQDRLKPTIPRGLSKLLRRTLHSSFLALPWHLNYNTQVFQSFLFFFNTVCNYSN